MTEKTNFFTKVISKCIRHPGFLLKLLHPKRIKTFFVALRTEGMDGVRRRFSFVESDFDHRGETFDASKLDLLPVHTDGKSREKTDYEFFSVGENNIINTEGYAKTDGGDALRKPEVSIIIPVFNQFDYTYNCIRQVKRHSGCVSYEIIIADDCSTDLTKDIEEIIGGLKVIHNDRNLRFLKNCNNAAKEAVGELILFLNNDTQVQDNWLEPLVDIMEDRNVGMTGSKLVYSNGALQEAGGIIWRDASGCNYGNRRNPDAPEYNYVREVDYISGASIMIRRSLWEEIGGFDESFAPAYYEDVDLAFEVRRRGFSVVYQPLSVVVHFEGVSNGTDLSSGQKSYQVANQKKFYRKWKDELRKNHFLPGENLRLASDRLSREKH